MEIKTVAAGRGAGWYADAWAIFKGQIGMWLLLILLYLGLAIVLGLIPFIGQLIFALISPALAGGLYLAAREAEAGRPLDVKLLFQPLTDVGSRGSMLTLGAISIAFSVVLMLTLAAIVGGSAGTSALLGQDPATISAQMIGAGLVGLLAMLLLSLVFLMAMLYAVPLVLFAGVPPMQSLKLSLKACLGNWLPLLIFGLILLPLAMLASLPLM
ncbi:MAG: BPSS1780 family membrane protein, partial [Gammaproteobacteria bacterium]|nr:BPSS1780 family membrane protein [Gammaproteobacteria bacterium]